MLRGRFRRSAGVLLAAAVTAALGAGTASAQERAPAAGGTPVFVAGAHGYDTFRIPSIVQTAGGTLLAFAEGRKTGSGDTGNIDLVLKRSTDGGRTWGPLQVVGDNGDNVFGNPTPIVVPDTGRVVLLSTHNAGTASEDEIVTGQVPSSDSRRVFVQYSEDEGATWSEPVEITGDVKKPHWRWYATGPVHGIVLQEGPHAGRLVAPANHSAAPPEGSIDTGAEDKYYGAHLLYSDDGGTTWHIGATDETHEGFVNSNETTVAELAGGTVYVNSRDQHGASEGVRAVTTSSDGGATFDHPYQPDRELIGPVVQGAALQVDGGPLLFSLPGDPTERAVMTVRASTDGGRSWTDGLVISEDPAAYSDMVDLGGGTVGLLYETGTEDPYEQIAFLPLAVGDITGG